MSESEFFDFVKVNYSNKDINLFREAVEFSRKLFGDEKRLSGVLVLEHNLAIGKILAKMKMPSEIVTAGLLYGLQNKILPSEIQKKFGKDVADLVFGQNQLKIIREKNKSTESDTLRKIILASLSDLRIIFVKLAAKLDNLQTVENLPVKEQKRIAQECLDIYSPIAKRFNLEYIKKNLDDDSFKILNPKKYSEISNFLKESKTEREKFIHDFLEEIKNILNGKIKNFEIEGREKQIYSIYKKIISRGIPLNKQKDHFALRIIVNSVDECYHVLGILHEKYFSVEGTLKDYIVSPKPNGYQSLHTIVKLPSEKIVEIQIRTKEMDESAEEGISAHWLYKGIKSDNKFEKKTAWLRSVLDLQNSCSDEDECLKLVKVNLFGDKIYCYTPKGKAIELPKGSTVLDFAYHIHQEIGEHSIGGRINGIYAPIDGKINSGDVIEIITNKNQRPRRDWLKFVVSGRAMDKIRQGINKYGNVPAPKRISVINSEGEEYDSVVYTPDFQNVKFNLARCCSPLPEQKIVAVMKFAKTFSVHTADCPRIENIKEKVVPVFWKETFNRPLIIKIYAEDRSGILADLLHTISRGGFIVKEAKAKLTSEGFSECSFVIVPRKLEEVVKLIKRIQKVRGVRKVFFE